MVRTGDVIDLSHQRSRVRGRDGAGPCPACGPAFCWGNGEAGGGEPVPHCTCWGAITGAPWGEGMEWGGLAMHMGVSWQCSQLLAHPALLRHDAAHMALYVSMFSVSSIHTTG